MLLRRISRSPRPTSTLLACALALVPGCLPREIAHTTTPPDAAPAWTASLAAAEDFTPAISLTASDGTGLQLVELEARAWVDAPLALTELHLTFVNPQDRTIEGTFEIQLPPRAAISRFAMKIGESWQEGEVVERQEARRVFEDFLHRRQDPALLEHDAGERFRARVFPIPARAHKQLILTYSQELAGSHADYRLPLAGLPQLDVLDVQVLGPDPARPGEVRELYRAHASAVARADDVVLRETGGPAHIGLRSGDLAIARITLTGADALPVDPPRAVTVLFDTSASQAARFPAKIAQLAALIERLAEVHGAALPVRVWCFDQEAVEIFHGPAGRFGRAHAEAILRRQALGASDLANALRAIRPGAQPGERLILLGDGVATAGDTGSALLDAVHALRQAGVARIDAILLGGNRDLATMTQLATADAGPRTGVVLDGDVPVTELVDRLHRPTFSNLRVTVPGSRWSWPERLDGVQQGDTVLVYADLPAGQPLEIELDGGLQRTRVPTRESAHPLLERAIAGARIARLLAHYNQLSAGDEDLRGALRRQIITLSRTHRVLGPFTGLLVLETEQDYQRYAIRRDALSDILTIGERGPELLHRDGKQLVLGGARGGTFETDADADTTGRDPDTDGDGLPDRDDRCPDDPETHNGYQDEDGCPDELPTQLARYTGTIRGIYFDRNSAKITPKRKPILDRAVAILREFPTIRLEISGHCAQGEKPELGLARATAVRDYLVDHGIDPARLDVRNAGLDEPVDTNKTAAGRAKHRRIEFSLGPASWAPAPPPPPPSRPSWTREPAAKSVEAPPYSGTFAEIQAAIASAPHKAVALARAWCDRDPADVLARIALGDALAALGDRRGAARAYGSLIDLFPARADLRRHAGQRLAALGSEGLALAIDTYARAVEQRRDHPTGHRLYAYALARAGRHAEAFAAILAGLQAGSSRARPGVSEVLRRDAGLLAAVWLARDPERRPEIEAQLRRWQIELPRKPSTQFVLTWETDANDVDLHVRDGLGEHAFYRRPTLPSGGGLLADVTSGYGPELFLIPGVPTAYPYTIEAHYFGQGPMGYGMGTLQILEHDGHGRLDIDERPFVIMNAGARVPLGTLDRRKP